MNRYLVLFLLLANISFAENKAISEEKKIIPAIEEMVEKPYNPNVDCLILDDENSIICKFEILREDVDQEITIHWVSPSGEISRSREMIIPAGDISVYDYRYLDGREGGKWNFKVNYKGNEYSAHFELK